MPSIDLDWLGAPPPPPLAAALAKAGIAVRRRDRREQAPCVIASQAGRRPRAPAAGSWIWVGDGAVSDGAATDAVLDGAYDVIPLAAPDAASRIAARARELIAIEPDRPEPPDLVAHSAAARRVVVQVARAARTSMAVLLSGETGTGKEVMARLVHRGAARREKVFVPRNSAAIPHQRIEAERVGQSRGPVAA